MKKGLNKEVKRIFCAMLAAIMLISIAPLTGMADWLGGVIADAANKQITEYSVGDIVDFGSYPQSKVTDSSLISALNAQGGTWQSYGYMSGSGTNWADGSAQRSDYMKYCDTSYNGSWYRGVKFTTYRPYETNYQSTTSTSYTFQDDNGYYINTTYWFKYETLKWRVLDPLTGLVLCENIIDSQPYSETIYSYGNNYYKYYKDSAHTIYGNNYYESSIREWLNDDFYNTAFTGSEKAQINSNITRENKAFSTSYSEYDSRSSKDSITLLTYSDMANTSYGFSSSQSAYDVARRAHSSDYAKCQGAWTNTGSSYQTANGEDTSHWWLRSSGSSSSSASPVWSDGSAHYSYRVDDARHGVRPAFNFNLKSVISDTNNILIERVQQYTADYNMDELEYKLKNEWDLNKAEDYNEYVNFIDGCSSTAVERWNYINLINNDLYVASAFTDYLHKPLVRFGLGCSALVYNDEAIGYIVGEVASVKKYKTALQKYMEANYADFKTLQYVKDTVSFLGTVSGAVGDAAEKAKIGQLMQSVSKCNTTTQVDNLLYTFDFSKQKYGSIVVDYNGGNKLAEAFGTAGDVIKVANIAASGIVNLMSVSSNLKIYKTYIDFLYSVASNKSLPVSLRTAANELSQSLGQQYIQAAADIATDIMKFATDKTIDVVKIGASTTLKGVIATVSIMKFLGNTLLGVSDIIKACAYIECYGILANMYKTILMNDKENFVSNQSYENAVKFRDDYEILRRLRLIGETTYQDMVSCENLWIPTVKAIMRKMSGYYDKKTYLESNINMIKNVEFSMVDTPYVKQFERNYYSDQLVIDCPVNVTVYDSKSNLVCRIENGVLDESVCDSASFPLVSYTQNESKHLLIPNGSDYKVIIQPFENGAMSCSSTKLDSGNNEISKANYNNVGISTTEKYSFNTGSDIEYSNLYKDDNTVTASEKTGESNSPQSIDVNVTTSGSGSVLGAGNYTQGDYVSLVATPEAGNKFECWKIDGKEVSNDNIYSFYATESSTLEAVFVSKDVKNVTYEQSISTTNDFYVTVDGRANKTRFIGPDGGTMTFDRFNDKVSITSYKADGTECSSLSRDLSYEIWKIHAKIESNSKDGIEMKAVAKRENLWGTDEYLFTVLNLEPVMNYQFYEASMAASSGTDNKVATKVVTGTDVSKIRLTYADGSAVTLDASKYAIVDSTNYIEKYNASVLVFTYDAFTGSTGENTIIVSEKQGSTWVYVDTLTYTHN